MALVNYRNPLSSDRPLGDQSPFGPSYYTPPTSPIAPTRPPTQTTGVTTRPSTATSQSSGQMFHPLDASGGGNEANPTPPETPTPPPNTPGAGTGTPPNPTAPGGHQDNALTQWARPQLQSAYRKYLGREMSDAEFWNYVGPNASEQSVRQAIEAVRTSPESSAYQQAHPTQWGQEAATSTSDTTDAGGIWGPGARPTTGRIKYGPNGPYWDPNDTGADQTSGGSGGSGTTTATTGHTGTSIFDDPATRNFETLLNQRIQELLGPAYTNSQMDLMQTQALDPLEVQRQQAKQQVIQRMASHGVPPSSGIVERALEDVDRQFNTLRTQSQSGFANKAIDQTAQNHNQAVSMAEIIPQMAWSRLQGANGAVSPMNSPALLSLLNSFQQSGYQNSNQFMQSLVPILMQLFQ